LSIPAIDVSTSLARLGLQPDRTVEVPSDADQAGWYELGTQPGDLGSAVILGHVDSSSGPAVFYRLSELRPGDRLSVVRLDGSTVHFEVTSVMTYANSAFPAQRVYAAQGRKRLNLVTCGGDYDASNGGYQSNVVVYTRWAGTSRS
jgi:sortase (surface protein transpeptidase)